MASPVPPLVFDTSFDPQTGRPILVAPGLTRITAPNASPYTFTGTNSFLLGYETLGLIDPGPDDPAHLDALRAAIGGRRVEAIILTHTHRDHCASAAALAAELGAALWFGGRHRLSRPLRRFETDPISGSSARELVPDVVLADGESFQIDGIPVSVHATPGHCANHLAFGLTGTEFLLTGDHIMGWNSTLVSVPDGSMADYLASLDKVIALPFQRYLPAHGGPIADGPNYARALKAHRLERNEQVLAAVGRGAHSLGAITGAVYRNIAPTVRRAAQMTVTAHVEYLEALGQLTVKRGLLGTRVSLPKGGARPIAGGSSV